MARVRLTRWDRESIRQRAMKDAFEAHNRFLDKRETLFVEAVARTVVTVAEIELAQQLDRRWFHLTNTVRVNLSGWAMDFYRRLGDDEQSFPIPNFVSCERINLEFSDPLCVEGRALAEAKKEVEAQRQAANNALNTVLNSCSTLKDLRERWPEGEPYYSNLAPPPEPKLPVASIKTLNALLGLPKET